jgi:hypothetical protein
MEQYNHISRHDMKPAAVKDSSVSQSNSHLYSLVHRLMETVEKQSRQISRLESTISEISSTMRNQ